MKGAGKMEFVDCNQAAEALQVHPQFLRKLVKQGRVPFYRLSERTLRFDLNELRGYMRLIAEGKPEIDK
jgi:excisionase family DNA binding protein